MRVLFNLIRILARCTNISNLCSIQMFIPFIRRYKFSCFRRDFVLQSNSISWFCQPVHNSDLLQNPSQVFSLNKPLLEYKIRRIKQVPPEFALRTVIEKSFSTRSV